MSYVLIYLRVPAAGNELIVHEDIAQLAARGLRALRELVRRPPQGAGLLSLRGVLRHVGVALAGTEEVDLPHPRVIPIAEVHAVVEGERERRLRADLRLRWDQVEESGQHRIDDDARAVVESKHQETATVRDIRERPSLERLIERLRRAQH